MIISVLGHNLYVTYRSNFNETYDYGAVMHMKFYQDVVSYNGVILPFDCLNFYDCFHPQSLLGNQ